jgi:uncharacterized protein (TIGR03435 family)
LNLTGTKGGRISGMRIAIGLALAGGLWAQTFEVASIKPSDPGVRGNTFNYTPGGGLTILNSTLRAIIQSAYDVPGFQIEGGPGWINSERFDVIAKSEAGDRAVVGQTRLKLQALIADRFRLKVRREMRDMRVLALAVGKNGPKLQAAAAKQTVPAGMHMSCGRMMGTDATMENFAHSLTRELGRPVVDRTGIAGKFDFMIEFTPEEGPCAADANDQPSIFGAIQELGLKLEATRRAVEVIVVDYAERPTGN